jgi:hypothetical protein
VAWQALGAQHRGRCSVYIDSSQVEVEGDTKHWNDAFFETQIREQGRALGLDQIL